MPQLHHANSCLKRASRSLHSPPSKRQRHAVVRHAVLIDIERCRAGLCNAISLCGGGEVRSRDQSSLPFGLSSQGRGWNEGGLWPERTFNLRPTDGGTPPHPVNHSRKQYYPGRQAFKHPECVQRYCNCGRPPSLLPTCFALKVSRSSEERSRSTLFQSMVRIAIQYSCSKLLLRMDRELSNWSISFSAMVTQLDTPSIRQEHSAVQARALPRLQPCRGCGEPGARRGEGGGEGG